MRKRIAAFLCPLLALALIVFVAFKFSISRNRSTNCSVLAYIFVIRSNPGIGKQCIICSNSGSWWATSLGREALFMGRVPDGIGLPQNEELVDRIESLAKNAGDVDIGEDYILIMNSSANSDKMVGLAQWRYSSDSLDLRTIESMLYLISIYNRDRNIVVASQGSPLCQSAVDRFLSERLSR